MARYDKYDSKISGPRAFLKSDWSSSDLEEVFGVGLDSSGLLVKGKGQTGIVGVLVLTRVIKAGREPVDVMTRGEIVAFDLKDKPNVANSAAAAGTAYYADETTGVVSTTSTGGIYVGYTVEASRLIVSCAAGSAAGGA